MRAASENPGRAEGGCLTSTCRRRPADFSASLELRLTAPRKGPANYSPRYLKCPQGNSGILFKMCPIFAIGISGMNCLAYGQSGGQSRPVAYDGSGGPVDVFRERSRLGRATVEKQQPPYRAARLFFCQFSDAPSDMAIAERTDVHGASIKAGGALGRRFRAATLCCAALAEMSRDLRPGMWRQRESIAMLYDSTKVLLREILLSLRAADQVRWDDEVELAGECSYAMHQMSHPLYQGFRRDPMAGTPSGAAICDRAARAVPHVKSMARAIRRRDRVAAVESGEAALAEM